MLIDDNALCSIKDLIPIITECVNSGRKVKMRVTGISMQPLLHNRADTVVLCRADKIKKYDIVLHKREDGSYILHRVVGKKRGAYAIAGDFETEREYPVYPNQILARAEGFERNGKYHSCSEPLFVFYAVLWTAVLPMRHIILRLYYSARRLLNGKK